MSENSTAAENETTTSGQPETNDNEFDIDRIAEESGLAEDYGIEQYQERYEEEVEIKQMNDYMKIVYASIVSSMVSTATCLPLNVVHEKMHQEGRGQILHTIRVIYIEHGLKRFWRNHTIAQFLSLFQLLTMFLTYEQVRDTLNLLPISRHQELCDFVAGFASGTAVVLFTYPWDAGARRLMARWHIMKKVGTVLATHKPLVRSSRLAIYRGAGTSLLHVAPLYGCSFLLYNRCCEMIVRSDFANRYDMNLSALLVSGAMSGCASCFICYPLESISLRLQLGALERQTTKFDETCWRVFQCIGVILRRKGLFGFYRGVGAAMLRCATYTSLHFGVFFKMRQWAGDNI